MAILNVTPDSYYAPSRAFNPELAIARGKQLHELGADLLDIGGVSTRPGAEEVDFKEELNRVLPVVQALAACYPGQISIDTYEPRVAEACVRAGATLINDITGFTHPAMRALAASTSTDLCVMHMQGTPQTMQVDPKYDEGVVPYLLKWFERQVHLLIKEGVKEERIILDPGIGFGKTVAHNVEILQNLPRFRALGFRVLLGASRKSFMSKILNKPTAELLAATLAVNAMALYEGVAILRVHDVVEHRDVIDLFHRLMRQKEP